ncbi:hypothetical protein PENSPDRAFT_646138 [Peniophora sp. CONT]|nr:hypothetical protein PENSPDRAFT_646138 [Peniophora sp. CONT]
MSFNWTELPAELHLAVLDHLDVESLLPFSTVSKDSRSLAVPRIFRTVTIRSFDGLQAFLSTVPVSYGRFIHELDVCTTGSILPCQNTTEPLASSSGSGAAGSPRTDALIDLLSRTPRLQRLTLRLSEGLHPKIAPSFETLDDLISLKIENCDDEEKAPLSESTVTAVALAVPKLEELSLTRITRTMHPDEYASSYTSSYDLFPAILDEQATSTHRLPALLTIPTLRHLAIHDTHLGDPLFTSPDLTTTSKLEHLELGAYTHASPEQNAEWHGHLLERAGPHLTHLTLGAGIPPLPTGALHLPKLFSARLTSSVSPLLIPSTLGSLAQASAPLQIHTLDMECLAIDFEDVVDELAMYMDSAPEEGCTFVDVRVHIAECEESDEVPMDVDVPRELDDENSRRLRGLEDACVRAGARVTVVGATASLGVVPTAPSRPIEVATDEFVVVKLASI